MYEYSLIKKLFHICKFSILAVFSANTYEYLTMLVRDVSIL